MSYFLSPLIQLPLPAIRPGAKRRGHPADVVLHVENLVLRAEYKRRQALPRVKITRRDFGRGGRYPRPQWAALGGKDSPFQHRLELDWVCG